MPGFFKSSALVFLIKPKFFNPPATMMAGGLRFKGTIKESDDLNNINVSCNYLVNGVVPKNYPKGVYNYGAVITEVISAITVQIVFTHSHSNSYLRVKYNSAEKEWNEWRKITSVNVS